MPLITLLWISGYLVLVPGGKGGGSEEGSLPLAFGAWDLACWGVILQVCLHPSGLESLYGLAIIAHEPCW